MSFSNVGKVWAVDSFTAYLNTIQKPSWCKAICIHHTAAPSLSQRPKGLQAFHIENMKSFYKDTKGWSAGPHLFTDEDQIYGMTPLTDKGVHAASFNSYSIGIEVLGDYDSEACDKGRGLDCWKTTAATVKALANWLEIPINSRTILFHRDDPKTNKTCPGTRVQKNWFLNMVNDNNVATEITKKHANANDMLVSYAVVSEYMQQFKGYNSEDVSKLLKKKDDGLFYFGEYWLEGAYYDAKKGSTVAPIPELYDVPKKGK